MTDFPITIVDSLTPSDWFPLPSPDPTVQEHAAIRNRIYVAGVTFFRDPVPVQIVSRRIEKLTPTTNAGLRADRLFVADGWPNIRNRHEVLLPWPDLRESALLEHLGVLGAIGQPFDVGLWKHVTDVFDGDAETTRFFIQRRQLLPTVAPAVTFPDYPTRAFVLDAPYGTPGASREELSVVQKTTASIEVGDPAPGELWIEDTGHLVSANLWASTVRVASAPPDMHDALVLIYLPLYSMLISEETGRSYAEALRESRGVRLVEFG